MIIIQHRVNKDSELEQEPFQFGVEMDIRDNGKDLIVSHDPFKGGELFSDWLESYQHSFLVVNVKSDGIENTISALLEKKGIKKYFFLDFAMPTLIRESLKKEKEIAVRFSEYEPLESVLCFSKKASWVWLDSFHTLNIDANAWKILKENFKVCLVSPELQGRDPKEIVEIRKKYPHYDFDAVCSKFPQYWL